MRTFWAARLIARSSDRPAILEILVPLLGSNSYIVTTGPGWISSTRPVTPYASSFSTSRAAFSFSCAASMWMSAATTGSSRRCEGSSKGRTAPLTSRSVSLAGRCCASGEGATIVGPFSTLALHRRLGHHRHQLPRLPRQPHISAPVIVPVLVLVLILVLVLVLVFVFVALLKELLLILFIPTKQILTVVFVFVFVVLLPHHTRLALTRQPRALLALQILGLAPGLGDRTQAVLGRVQAAQRAAHQRRGALVGDRGHADARAQHERGQQQRHPHHERADQPEQRAQELAEHLAQHAAGQLVAEHPQLGHGQVGEPAAHDQDHDHGRQVRHPERGRAPREQPQREHGQLEGDHPGRQAEGHGQQVAHPVPHHADPIGSALRGVRKQGKCGQRRQRERDDSRYLVASVWLRDTGGFGDGGSSTQANVLGAEATGRANPPSKKGVSRQQMAERRRSVLECSGSWSTAKPM